MLKKTENINFTLSHDLCTGCGVCAGACPSGALSFIVRKGRFLPSIDEDKCNNRGGCHRCYDVCPGVGVDLKRIAAEQFNDTEVREDRLIGKFRKCYVGHSTDDSIRLHSASGGMVSSFLIWLLENNYIDGAVVTAFDNSNELMVRSYIATTREEVFAAKSSKYAPVSLHRAAQDIKAASGSRYVIVGLPCHIEGFRKLEKIDRKFREKIAGYFGIYCSSGRTFYLTEHVMKENGIDRSKLTYFAYRDNGCLGDLVAKYGEEFRSRGMDGNTSGTESKFISIPFQRYYHPLRSFFIPKRCLFCVDHYAELADISFGDIHVEPYIKDKVGINSLVVRKKNWQQLLEAAKKDGAFVLDDISAEILNLSQKMAYKKKGRNARFIKINEMFGGKSPKYDTLQDVKVKFRDVINWLQNRGQQFLGRHKSLWWLITLLKKDTSNLR